MKKSLFYSVAIAAAMVSCTQEAIEVQSNNLQDLSIRPVLGEVVLGEDATAASRFATGNGAQAKFEEGDKLGAAIMDMPLYTGMTDYNTADAKANYQIVNYYSSNSAFSYEGGAWFLNEDQPLVEGNYLFYAPYNQAMQLRTPFEVAVPKKQDASTAKAALDEYYASGAVVKVGYQFLAADGGQAQRPSVSMQDVMAYPKFTIKNNFKGYLVSLPTGTLAIKNVTVFNGGTIKVDSIELVSTKDVVVAGELNNAKLAATLSGKWAETPFENYTQDLFESKTTSVTAGTPITTLVANREIAAGESAEFYAVMPAVSFATNELKANIYVTINEKPYVISTGNITRSDSGTPEVTTYAVSSVIAGGNKFAQHDITLIKGQRYPQEELNFADGVLSAKSIAGESLTINLQGELIAAKNTSKTVVLAQEIEVATTPGGTTPSETELIDNNAEFIEYFKNLLNGSALTEDAAINGTQFAFSATNTVEINSELIDALSKFNHKGSLAINTALPIADDVEVIEVSGDNVTFKSTSANVYTIELGTGYTVDPEYVESTGKSIHVLGTYSMIESVTGNVVIYESANATVAKDIQFEATSLVNYGTLNAQGYVIKPVINNGTISAVNTQHLVVNGGVGTIRINHAYNNVNVSVTGGEQTGLYIVNAALTAAIIKEAEAFDWVNELDLTSNVSVAFNKAMLDEIVDITTIHVKGASFPAETIDMNGLTLCMEGTGEMTISGVNKSLTKVDNVVIKNATTNQVTLTNIAATGEYVKVGNAGEIYANGTNATWNGAAAGVKSYVVAGSVYTVNNMTGILQIAELINAGQDFTGKTIKLAADIDMDGIEFRPLGDPADQSKLDPAFAGVFDGNGKTISNLSFDKETCYAGLFGVLKGTVKNLTLSGVNVNGTHCVGAIAGQAYGGAKIQNCVVENSSITGTYLNADDSGDKVGALVGILDDGSTRTSIIENCKAINCTVSANRDAGQIVGAADATKVTGCTATNVSVIYNKSNESDPKAGQNINNAIVGRIL